MEGTGASSHVVPEKTARRVPLDIDLNELPKPEPEEEMEQLEQAPRDDAAAPVVFKTVPINEQKQAPHNDAPEVVNKPKATPTLLSKEQKQAPHNDASEVVNKPIATPTLLSNKEQEKDQVPHSDDAPADEVFKPKPKPTASLGSGDVNNLGEKDPVAYALPNSSSKQMVMIDLNKVASEGMDKEVQGAEVPAAGDIDGEITSLPSVNKEVQGAQVPADGNKNSAKSRPGPRLELPGIILKKRFKVNRSPAGDAAALSGIPPKMKFKTQGSEGGANVNKKQP